MPDLKLLVHAPYAAAIIGKGGHKVRAIKIESGVEQIHLSQHDRNVALADRTVTITGDKASLQKAFTVIAQVVRAEARLAPGDEEMLRLIVPDAESLIGKRIIRQLQTASGAKIEVAPMTAKGTGKERLVTCTGQPEQTELVAHRLAAAIATRHTNRHKDFLAQWGFETNYNDHFETPSVAFTHIVPLLHQAASGTLEATPVAAGEGAPPPSTSALERLVVYDPYYCKGAVVAALASLGVRAENVLNRNRDFYADIAAGAVPRHDVLVTNPPYSADHKLKLLDFISSGGGAGAKSARTRRKARRPFCLLMPAWVVATDYWQAFLRTLADGRVPPPDDTGRAPSPLSRRPLERRAGVFYISPKERYSFAHPQSTGHATSPFHSIWFCGGWRKKAARRAALAALRALRKAGAVEVFRDSAMLQRRGHFVPASAAKQMYG